MTSSVEFNINLAALSSGCIKIGHHFERGVKVVYLFFPLNIARRRRFFSNDLLPHKNNDFAYIINTRALSECIILAKLIAIKQMLSHAYHEKKNIVNCLNGWRNKLFFVLIYKNSKQISLCCVCVCMSADSLKLTSFYEISFFYIFFRCELCKQKRYT